VIEFNFFLCHVQCEKGKVNYCTSSYGGGYGGGGGGYGEAVFQLFTNQVLLDKTPVTKRDRTIKDIPATLLQTKKNQVNERNIEK
jgi:threonine dehydrogenase-like Zn-dependent dehydrogenase